MGGCRVHGRAVTLAVGDERWGVLDREFSNGYRPSEESSLRRKGDAKIVTLLRATNR
jgi:hypothetical protein